MKYIPILCTLLFLAALMAMRPLDALTDTGVTFENVRQGVLDNLAEEKYFLFNSTSAMRKIAKGIPENAQATTVRALGKWVRSYVESDNFKQEYRQWLKQKYPVDETYSDAVVAQREQAVGGMDAAISQQMALIQQTYAQLDPAMLQMGIKSQLSQQEAQLATLEGEERAAKARELAELKKILAATEGKSTEFKKQFMAYHSKLLKQGSDQSKSQQQKDLANAQERNVEYKKQTAILDAHSDFRPLLRQRLKNFIALCDEVDFNAKLVPSGRKQEFINPLYQRKPAEWKFLYRLGKTPVLEARAFAQEWLTDLK
ncbi:hypothetical protein [Runella salmonicolor]|uniref:Uncharacterized protein n=1 Tax=Runella salmonicolor TaxID=2950278 RepID=A0ABT1FP60_9BACT|nr:hypothetical protein [Runella salmonicolor]MCP1383558.1 hypothetical protein [Runella salmonicolor]